MNNQFHPTHFILFVFFFLSTVFCHSESGNSDDVNNDVWDASEDTGNIDDAADGSEDCGELDSADSGDVKDSGHSDTGGHDAGDATDFAWDYSTITAYNHSVWGRSLQAAIDHTDNDKIYVVHFYRDQASGLFLTSFNGFSWQLITSNYGNYGENLALVIDSSHRAHVAYSDGALRYAVPTGPLWDISQPDPEPNTGHEISIALDSENYPHISYRTWSSRCELRHSYFNGTAWLIETVDSFVGNGTGSSKLGGSAIAIDADSANQVHIVYQAGEVNNNMSLKYATPNGITWSIKTIQENKNYFVRPQLFIDNQHQIHLQYTAADNAYRIMYAKFSGNSSSIVPVELGQTPSSSGVSMDMSVNSSTLHFVWPTWTGSIDAIGYFTNPTGAWQGPRFLPFDYYFTEVLDFVLLLDSIGKLHLVFQSDSAFIIASQQ